MVRESGKKPGIETLGELVHNRQVQSWLAERHIRAVESVDQLSGDRVVIGAHGVGPNIIEELKSKGLRVIDTTCPYVRRAQRAALKLHKDGFYVVIFGDGEHAEVKGIVEWAGWQATATMDPGEVAGLRQTGGRLGIVAQTTQVPYLFASFISSLVESGTFKDSELRIIDTICHDSRTRQVSSLEMAGRCDLVYVIGGRHSANTFHLRDLCSTVTRCLLIETGGEIEPSDLKGLKHVGITAGASTDDETIREVVKRLEQLSNSSTFAG